MNKKPDRHSHPTTASIIKDFRNAGYNKVKLIYSTENGGIGTKYDEQIVFSGDQRATTRVYNGRNQGITGK